MSSWAQSTPRTYMNDANRSRFSANAPATENLPQSVGPCAYTPIVVKPRLVGQVILHKTQDGVPERVKEIYGVPTSKILPIHAMSYDPKGRKVSPFDSIVQNGEAFQQSFRSKSPRQLWATTDQTRSPEEYPPGPNTYTLPSPNAQSTTPRAPYVFVPGDARQSNSPIQKEPLPSLAGTMDRSMLSSSGYSAISPRSLRLSPSSTVSPQKGVTTLERFLPPPPSPRNGNSTPGNGLGASISRSPRHLNMHNLNSLLPREKDSDYNNPSPAHYEVAKQTTSFAPSPHKRS